MELTEIEQEIWTKRKLIERTQAASEKLRNFETNVFERYSFIQRYFDSGKELKVPDSVNNDRLDQWVQEVKTRFSADRVASKLKPKVMVLSDNHVPARLLDLLIGCNLEVTLLTYRTVNREGLICKVVPKNTDLTQALATDADLIICTSLGTVLDSFEMQKAPVLYWVHAEDIYLNPSIFREVLKKLPFPILGSPEDQLGAASFLEGRTPNKICSVRDMQSFIKRMLLLPAIPCGTTMNSQELSVCMIVKDEEENLPRCLEQVVKFADEIIIVDTGSRDKSVEIAKQYGAKVFYYKWHGDFGAARTESLRHATKDWILVLDADEVLDEVQGVELKSFIQRALGKIYQVSIHNFKVADLGVLVNQMVRLFRNRKGFIYKGTIHEQLISETDESLEILESPFAIQHYGYTTEIVEKRGKKARNKEILVTAVEDEPKNPFHLFNLGQHYMVEGDLQKALPYFQKAFSYSNSGASYRSYLLNNLATCLLMAERNKEALQVLEDASRVYSLYPDFYFLKGQIYLKQKRFYEAKQSFVHALSVGDISNKLTSFFGRGSFLSAYFLAVIAREEGEKNKALKILESWMPRFNTLPQPKKLWAELACASLTLHEIQKHLETKFWQSAETLYEILLFLIASFLEKYQHENALLVLEQFPDHFKQWDAWKLYRGLLAYRQDSYSLAWEYWRGLSDPYQPKSSLILAFAHWVEGRTDKASALSENVHHFFEGIKIPEDEASILIRELLWYKGKELESSLWNYPDKMLLGRLLLEYERKDLAGQVLIEAAQNGTITAEGLKILGDLSKDLGFPDDAEVFWTQALSMDEESWDLYTRLLQLYTSQKQKEKIKSLVYQRRKVFYPEKLLNF